MERIKKIKDPIYGYISVPEAYMDIIIDTPNFQRLRRVIQTSYTPLYSSAVHNRFVHSLGVYHLGQMVAERLTKEFVDNNYEGNVDISDAARIFILACLLHDVGHAPFSHTGENFYLDGDSYNNINQLLLKEVGIDTLKEDMSLQSNSAAPHEIMSAIVGIKLYGGLIGGSKQKEFFARCITGYKYKKITEETSIFNCFINMLNSKVIDVDRLDYLIRDAYVSGFNTVNIDYDRLLNNLTVIKSKEKGRCYELAYKKNAVSVIENVVYSHDAERKWIQTHPVVLYEDYILKHVISELNERLNTKDKKLFSVDALMQSGIYFDNGIFVSLMCDDDIIYIMKYLCKDDLSREFFDRRERRHPLWKSEAEYMAFVSGLSKEGTLNDKFNEAMEETSNYLLGCSGTSIIKEETIRQVEEELEKIEDLQDEDEKEAQRVNKLRILKVMKLLYKFAEDNEIDCDFVLLGANQFNSGFNKPDFANINIVFDTSDKKLVKKFKEVTNTLKANDQSSQRFYYLYYKRKDKKIPQSKIYNLIREMLYKLSEED